MKKYPIFLFLFLVLTLSFGSITSAQTTQATNGCLSGYKFNPDTGLPCLGYSTSSSSGSVIKGLISLNRVIKLGMKGSDVSQIQQFLKEEGYYTGKVDGSYGPRSARAVREFQEDSNIAVNGTVDSDTLTVMNSMILPLHGQYCDECVSTPTNTNTNQNSNLSRPQVYNSPAVLSIDPPSLEIKAGASQKVSAFYFPPCTTTVGSNCSSVGTDVSLNGASWKIANDKIAGMKQVSVTCVQAPCPAWVEVVGVSSGSTTLESTYKDSNGTVLSKTIPVKILANSTLEIVPNTLSNCKVGVSCSMAIEVWSGGTPSFTWSVASGSLPPGMNFQGTVCVLANCRNAGNLYGTPTTPGTYTFSLKAADSSSVQISATKQFTLTIDPASTTTTTTTTVPASISLNPSSLSLKAGELKNIITTHTASCTSPLGSSCASASKEVMPEWSSSNTGVARIDIATPRCSTAPCPSPTATVFAVAPGTATLTAKYVDGNTTLTKTLDIVVAAPPATTTTPASLKIDPVSVSVVAGSMKEVKGYYTQPCTATVGTACSGVTTEVSPSWSIANTAIAELVIATPRCSTGSTCNTYVQVSGKSAGSTELVATYQGITTRIPVVVSAVVSAPTTPSTSIVGYLDSASCSVIGGWALNLNSPSSEMTIRIYDEVGGLRSLLSYTSTSGLRPDINTAYGATGNHGFTINTPSSVKDGRTHKISVMAVDANLWETQLSLSPQYVTCSVASLDSDLLVAGAIASASNTGESTRVSLEKHFFTKEISLGSVGEEVRELQKYLNTAGYKVGLADGVFGKKVREALMKLQKDKGLKVDGLVGKEVLNLLNK